MMEFDITIRQHFDFPRRKKSGSMIEPIAAPKQSKAQARFYKTLIRAMLRYEKDRKKEARP